MYVVHYLDARARAEPIWLLLSYARVPAVRHDFSLAELQNGARVRDFPTSQLPVLEIVESGAQIAQSGTIMRYLARQHGLVPDDALEAAKVDEVFELSQEFGRVNPFVNIYNKEQAKIDEFLRKGAGDGSGYPVLPRLDALASRLGEMLFFGGDKPAYCDFNCFHYLDNLDTLLPNILKDHQLLIDWMVRLANLPDVKTYLASRAQQGSDKLGMPGSPIQTVPTHAKPWSVAP